ncbi:MULTISPECIES: hypothetical protein [unclassified Lentimonas]|uniref:hypothetical protein n=1 Tax=unclassified Lentimonas TaxID=2630993 RepID=UPI001A7EB4B8|nr:MULTISPECIES: hypothetical protein [unclassified Lentimonas]
MSSSFRYAQICSGSANAVSISAVCACRGSAAEMSASFRYPRFVADRRMPFRSVQYARAAVLLPK